MKVMMIPQPTDFGKEESGIKRVVDAYYKYMPQYGIQWVPANAKRYDLKAAHAGMSGGDCDVAILHGLYWTADYPATNWEYKSNENIVNALHHAKEVTVPSPWVAEVFQRDMRFTPHIIPHGIEWDEWQHKEECQNYVLWNKNRAFDVCSPDAMAQLARISENVQFITTFKSKTIGTSNVKSVVELGLAEITKRGTQTAVPHAEMKKLIQRAGVYLSTTKETFGIGALEAMAAGVPVLGWGYGGNVDLIQHGVNGYLAEPGNIDDLKAGLEYCLQYRQTLGDNGRELARGWTWTRACELLWNVFQLAYKQPEPDVDIVIPVYNKPPDQLQRCIASAQDQTYTKISQIIVVDDGSKQELAQEYDAIVAQFNKAKIYHKENGGVATARNYGIAQGKAKYVSCIDADDWYERNFIERCVIPMEKDYSLGIAYAGLKWWKDGEWGVSQWPGQWDYNKQSDYYHRHNQVPTCNVMRRKMFERMGGYRQRYAPDGAGAEDAELWTRCGAYGWRAEKVTEEALFNYSFGGQVSSNKEYHEPDWLALHPWTKDREHPFASYATPKEGAFSHQVRQYDEPVVSVVIPVGPGHSHLLVDALDSLEAQTFRKWEAIVVYDGDSQGYEELRVAYPYIRPVFISQNRGAGYARNRGVDIARAPFLTFLDVDDTFHPQFLELCLSAWNEQRSAIYTDYVGEAYITPEYARKLDNDGRLQSYNDKNQCAIIKHRAFDFDCERAQAQPDTLTTVYIWNLITTLFPTAWHYEIGGFDEQMETWEDWDYWLRMAKAGKCFYRLEQELVRYRYYTGTRRGKAAADTIEGRQIAKSMLEYIKGKDIQTMPCPGGCGKKTTPQVFSAAHPQMRARVTTASVPAAQVATADGNMDFIRCVYAGSKGASRVIGAAVFAEPYPGRRMIRRDNGYKFDYGYIGAGEEVNVHREDIKQMPGKWLPKPGIELPEPPPRQVIPEPVALMQKQTAPTAAPPEAIKPPEIKQFQLEALAGVTPKIAAEMTVLGLITKEDILKAGIDGLVQIKGVTPKRAEIIIRALAD